MRVPSYCILSEAAAEQFRRESKRRTFKDEAEGHTITVYRHPDGRILIDEIGLFKKSGESRI